MDFEMEMTHSPEPMFLNPLIPRKTWECWDGEKVLGCVQACDLREAWFNAQEEFNGRVHAVFPKQEAK